MNGTRRKPLTWKMAVDALVAARRRELLRAFPGDLLGEYMRLIDAGADALTDGRKVYRPFGVESVKMNCTN